MWFEYTRNEVHQKKKNIQEVKPKFERKNIKDVYLYII